MSSNKRQELYDRIRASSKDEVILEEMKRLGFWPADQEQADFSETLIERKGTLQRELHQLLQQQQLYSDPQEALKAMRKQRMAESKQRQKENREHHLRERHEKAMRWYQRRQREIVYVGDKVSAGLNDTQLDEARLKRFALPQIADAQALSTAMGISLAELRFLSFSRDISSIHHYQRFMLPKKSGGERAISAPMPRLKRAQYWVLANILEKIPLHEAAHGFRPGRSIVSNAQPHCRAHVVLNYDFKDFFPSLKYPRIRGLYRSLGYSGQVATLLALLTTEADVQQVTLDGEHYYVKQGDRHLPQGAPSSPALTNILCRRLDARLLGAAQGLGFRYTRYADDLTFSGDRQSLRNLKKLQWRLRAIVKEEGFQLHPEKSRVMRDSARQEVTGIVVNEKPSLDRKTLRRFRALLHRMERQGPEGCHWGNSPNVLRSAAGYAHFVAMVDTRKGQAYLQQIARIARRFPQSSEPFTRRPLSPPLFKAAAAAGQRPRESWWVAKELPPPEMPPMEESKKTSLAKEGGSVGQGVSNRRETTTNPESSSGDTYHSASGFFRRLLGRLVGGAVWLLVILVGIILFQVSPVLGLSMVAAIAFFYWVLRNKLQ
ncbi:MAG: reverse transcriptase family protein [Candidatus Thiodiazotropha sp.]